jgi:KDO2-lipid IV(A) lauroyltransferase
VLGHLGNWDLAGAWATPHLAPVLTVAEKLEPKALFEEFVAFRRSIGIEVLGLGDPGVFRALVRGARNGPRIVPLLADRDLTDTGVEVNLLGHRARVAAGPATLALTAGVDLLPLAVVYERLDPARRRVAGTPWGVVLRFSPPVPVPPEVEPHPHVEPEAARKAAPGAVAPGVTAESGAAARHRRVQTMTQSWVDALGETLRSHTQDWHMLQRVFVDDLDPGARKGPG